MHIHAAMWFTPLLLLPALALLLVSIGSRNMQHSTDLNSCDRYSKEIKEAIVSALLKQHNALLQATYSCYISIIFFCISALFNLLPYHIPVGVNLSYIAVVLSLVFLMYGIWQLWCEALISRKIFNIKCHCTVKA